MLSVQVCFDPVTALKIYYFKILLVGLVRLLSEAGQGSESQHRHGDSLPSITPVTGNLTPLF